MGGQPTESKSDLSKFSLVLKNTKNRELLKGSLVEGIDINRFIKCAWIQAQISPDIRQLAQSNPSSVFRAMLQCAQMGLYPDGISGDAYLVKFGNECVAIRGYKGLQRLFIEHCEVASKVMPIIYDVVYENDKFEYERGTSPMLSHKPAIKDRGEITHYWAAARFNDGSIWPKVMTADEVEAFKAYSRSKAFWDSEHDNTRKWMRLKTVIKQLMKELPLPSTVRNQVEREEETSAEIEIDDSALELPEETPHVYGDQVKKTQGKAIEEKPIDVIAQPVPIETGEPIEEEPEREPGSDDELFDEEDLG